MKKFTYSTNKVAVMFTDEHGQEIGFNKTLKVPPFQWVCPDCGDCQSEIVGHLIPLELGFCPICGVELLPIDRPVIPGRIVRYSEKD